MRSANKRLSWHSFCRWLSESFRHRFTSQHLPNLITIFREPWRDVSSEFHTKTYSARGRSGALTVSACVQRLSEKTAFLFCGHPQLLIRAMAFSPHQPPSPEMARRPDSARHTKSMRAVLDPYDAAPVNAMLQSWSDIFRCAASVVFAGRWSGLIC